jgi:hypothetical protein
MDIQIMEEKKRTELLMLKRENELVEYEFKGRAKGHNLSEFMAGIDGNLTAEQKLDIWKYVPSSLHALSLSLSLSLRHKHVL